MTHETTKEQRQAHFEVGLRLQIAHAKGELPGEELNPEWAEWAESLLDQDDRIAALVEENERLRKIEDAALNYTSARAALNNASKHPLGIGILKYHDAVQGALEALAAALLAPAKEQP